MTTVLAYAAFILILAAPFLVVILIAMAFLTGVRLIAGRPIMMLVGLALLGCSSTGGAAIVYWVRTPPPVETGSLSMHAIVYKTYWELQAQNKAMQWLHDGTIQRLQNEQRANLARVTASDKKPAPVDPAH